MEHTKSTALVILFVGGLVGARVGWTGAMVGWIGAAVGATGAGVGVTGFEVGATGFEVGATGAGVTTGAIVGERLYFFFLPLFRFLADFPPFLIPFPFLRIRDTLVAASA